MKYKFLLLCSVAALFGFAACTEKNEPALEEEGLYLSASKKGDAQVVVDKDRKTASVEFSSYSSYAMVDVETVLDWDCIVNEEAASWCQAEAVGGGVRILVQTNESFKERSATVTIASGEDAMASVAVKQAGRSEEPELKLEHESLVFPEAGRSVTFSVLTNTSDWEVSAPADASWLSVTPDYEANTVTVTSDANATGADRSAQLTFSCKQDGEVLASESLPVEQWGPCLTFTVSVGAGDKIALPLAGKDMDLKINWGEGELFDPYHIQGTIASVSTMVEYLSYTYKDGGEYDVTVHGHVPIITAYLDNVLMDSKYMRKITAVKSWGKEKFSLLTSAFYGAGLKTVAPDTYHALDQVTDVRSLFMECSNLESVPADLFSEMKAVDFNSVFFGCSSLTEIPAGLFDKNTAVTSFVSTFKGTGIGTVPAGLFDKNAEVECFESTFADCQYLESVPEGLFKNNTKVTSFNSTFSGTGLKTVPAGLFSTNTEVTDFDSVFYESSLEVIPAGLFAASKKVETFESAFNRTAVSEIPAGLFDSAVNAKSFKSTFYSCENLSSVPAGLFDKCVNVTSFNQTFNHCSSLTAVPTGLFDNCPLVEDVAMCFKDTGISEIPAGILDKLAKLTSVQSLFEDCVNISSVPDRLFAKCTSVTDFSNVFAGCSGIKTLGSNIFPASTVNLSSAFEGCSSLAEIPEGIFSGLSEVTKFDNVFEGCTSIVTVPAELFKDNTKVTSFQYAFRNCENLVTVGNPDDADGCIFKYAPDATDFGYVFQNCSALERIPAHSFAYNKKAFSFQCTFDECRRLTGESPYAEVEVEVTADDGSVSKVAKKIHLYERELYPDVFTAPYAYSYCFYGCEKLSDYDNIPYAWN